MKPPEGLAGLAAREAGHLEEPPPADARLLALANRALAERVAELEAEVERLRYALDIERAASRAASADHLDTVQAGYEEGVDDERAVVVAWLRTQRLYCTDSTGTPNAVSATYAHAAEAIEGGDHRREEKP